MNTKEVLTQIQRQRKGTFTKVAYVTYPKLKAKYKSEKVEKRTEGIFRFGITYANLKTQKGKEVGGLPWGSWSKVNYIINHKDKDYLRVYTTKAKAKTTWYLNGNKVEYEEVAEMVTASSKPTDCFTIAIENIVSIG